MGIRRLSLVHHTSNPFARNAAIALAEANLLHEVITTIAYNPKGRLAQALQLLPSAMGRSLSRELERRTWVAPGRAVIQSHPWREALRVSLVKSGLSTNLGLGKQGPINWVYAALDRHVAQQHLDHLDAIYAYEDSAASTFQVAQQRGIACFYELPIVFHRTSRQIQQDEASLFPELASSLQAVHDPAWKLERKDQEIALADHIFVPSSMVRQSLLQAGVAPDCISIISYGAPVDYFRPQPKRDKTFRALFVGRVGPRKGVHYLLQAWKNLQFSDAELKLVGVNEFPHGWLEAHQDRIHYLPTVPHASLGEHYRSASVFVLPSLVEGLSLVQLEAMACGVPIITTPNAAGPEIITDGIEGFIVAIRDVEALQEKLEWCYQNPEKLASMGLAARRRAEYLTWERYRQRFREKVSALLSRTS